MVVDAGPGQADLADGLAEDVFTERQGELGL